MENEENDLEESEEEIARMKVAGPFTIYEATRYHGELLSCFENKRGVEVDLSEVSDCDAAGIQLLISAGKTAKEKGIGFVMTRPAGVLDETLRRAGFDPEAFFREYQNDIMQYE